MFDPTTLLVFVAAASVIAVTPGPGIFYVAARTLAGGRSEGMASSFGTGVGGFVHVIAGAAGLSTLVMASAEAFTVLKICGALYLLWLGYKTYRDASILEPASVQTTGSGRAFREGILVEALNPKTAAFFLAFLPQFVDPTRDVAIQFICLGTISVVLNTLVDVVVANTASRAMANLDQKPGLIRRLRQGSGAVMMALGATLLLARKPG